MARTPNRDSSNVTLRITREQKRKLVRISESKGLTMTDLIVGWIDRAAAPTRVTTGETRRRERA